MLITAFLSIISCGTSKQHPTHIGLCLFTFTKLRIRDNAQHCRVPEIRPVMSRWARWRTLAHIFVVRKNSKFRATILLLVRLSPVTNSLLNAVFTFTQSFYSVSHSLEHYIASIFQKPLRLDMIRIYHHACRYTTFERCFDLAPSKSMASIGTSPRIESFKLSNLAIYMITDCLLPIDNRKRLASTLPKILWTCCSHATYSSLEFSWVAC